MGLPRLADATCFFRGAVQDEREDGREDGRKVDDAMWQDVFGGQESRSQGNAAKTNPKPSSAALPRQLIAITSDRASALRAATGGWDRGTGDG
jgi:hypothetical protein